MEYKNYKKGNVMTKNFSHNIFFNSSLKPGKRIISFLIILTLLFVLLFNSACSSKDEYNTDPESSQEDSDNSRQGNGNGEISPTVEVTPEATPEPTPDPDAKYIALTFDDGPSPERTERLLSILEAENVKATFFVLGQSALTYPEIVSKIDEDGHEIANHTYDHNVLTGDEMTMESIGFQMDRTNEIIEEITGRIPISFRPPQGAYNANVRQAAEERGLAIYHWSWESCPEDWKNTVPEVIANIVVENARDGHLVLLHDTKNHTIDSVRDIIKGLKEKGFVFVTVTELIKKGPDENPIPGKVYSYNFS